MYEKDKTKVMHAALKINGGHVYVCDCFDEMPSKDPLRLKGTPVTLNLNKPTADEVDAAATKAEKAGAKITMPVADQFWGARYGVLTDPFGHVWSLHGPPKVPMKQDEPKDGAKGGAKEEEDAEEEAPAKAKGKGKKRKAPAKKKGKKAKEEEEEEEEEGDD